MGYPLPSVPRATVVETLIGSWVGRTVTVTLKVGGIAGAIKVEGRLVRVGDAGLVLETGKGQTFIPIGSTLHISLPASG